MNRFTISPEFLEASANLDVYYDCYADVLMVFAQDNQYRLCIDEGGFASAIYLEIIKKHQSLLPWLKLLNNRKEYIEIVTIPQRKYKDNQELFLFIANEVPPCKRLLTFSKAAYNGKQAQIRKMGITLIDGAEAKKEFRENIKGTTYNIYQTTYGDNSHNMIGDNNK